MKLSEAIRLGSMLAPQGFGHYKFENKTCALGAALDAVGYQNIPVDGHFIEMFPVLETVVEQCNICPSVCYNFFGGDLLSYIMHLNDEHKLIRERIADFVEEIENGTRNNLHQRSIEEELRVNI